MCCDIKTLTIFVSERERTKERLKMKFFENVGLPIRTSLAKGLSVQLELNIGNIKTIKRDIA